MVHCSPFRLFWRSQETTLRKNFKIGQYLPIIAVKPLIINPIDLHKKKMKAQLIINHWTSGAVQR